MSAFVLVAAAAAAATASIASGSDAIVHDAVKLSNMTKREAPKCVP